MIGILGPAEGCALHVVQLQRVSQLCCHHFRGIGGVDQQPRSGVCGVQFWQVSLLPFDGQQPLVQHAITVAVFGNPGTELQAMHSHQHIPVLIQHIQVSLDRGRVSVGYPRIAVVSVAGGRVGTDPTDAQRQHQAAVTGHLDIGVGTDGLETGIQ
ncbi:hypothetical protein MYBA111488_00645 [Mycobacterium basiliense]